MSDEFIPTLTHATERDIDLLLVEEAYSSPRFVAALARKVGITKAITGARVLHSKRRTRNRREIDIFLELHHGPGKGSALLIENKLDASEQPDQAESYREEIALIGGGYAKAAIMIVCPVAYDQAHRNFTSKFDAVMTYEELAEWFAKEARAAPQPWASRLAFRQEILEQAIGKHRRGYTPVPNIVIGSFNSRYVALLARIAPSILPGPSMLKPANPDESVSMIFDVRKTLASLPDEVRPTRFSHELGHGKKNRANYVAVTFAGWGAALPSIKEQLERDSHSIGARFFAPPPNKGRPNPGLVMACATDPVDNQGSFEMQQDTIINGIKKAIELQKWLQSNNSILNSWYKLVSQYNNSTNVI